MRSTQVGRMLSRRIVLRKEREFQVDETQENAIALTPIQDLLSPEVTPNEPPA